MDNNISSTVRDYYDLLFDNVDYYREIVQTQLADLREENSEIQEKLKRNGPDIDHAALSKRFKENIDLIETTISCLQSDVVIKEGISLSAEILYDSEIELSDRFKEAPASEKYDYLLEKFSQDYTQNLNKMVSDAENNFSESNARAEKHKCERPAAWENLRSFGTADWKWSGAQVALDSQAITDMKRLRKISEYAECDSVVSLDARWSAVKKIECFFPDVVRQRQEETVREYSERFKNEPVRLYSDLIEKYSADYAGELGEEHSAVTKLLEDRKKEHEEHDAVKPGLLGNLVSFGAAEKSWSERQNVLLKDINHLKCEENRLWSLRQDAAGGWKSETVCEHVKEVMQSKHPELVEMCGIYVQRYWEEMNTARLERQNSRQDDRRDEEDKMVRKGVER